MGFHINKRRFEDVDKTQKIDESKLYINADYDQVYKIARLYLEKAKERGINYGRNHKHYKLWHRYWHRFKH